MSDPLADADPDRRDNAAHHLGRFSRWWLDRSVRVKGLTVLAVPLLAFIAVTIAGIELQQQERTQRAEALSATTLTTAAAQLLADAVDAENDMRGYVATGNSKFLKPYALATGAGGKHATALRAASTDTAENVLTLKAVRQYQAVVKGLSDLHGLVVQGRPPSKQVKRALLHGKFQMDALRADIDKIKAAPSKTTNSLRDRIANLERVIEIVELVGLGVGLLAGLAGVALFASGVSERVRVAAENASRLGHGEPLVATPRSADELGRLGDSLFRTERLMATRLDDLAAARDQAVLATQTKNTFLSRTSHELRTPLNAILGFAQLLEMSDLNADDHDSAQRILAAGRHLLALINELIDTARVESGELRLSLERVWLDSLTDEVASLIGPQAAARGITIVHDRPGPDIAALADKQRLRQVLVNLGSNAVKYNHHGGTITMTRRPGPDNTIELAVTDTGPGLSPSEIERIFVPFERLEAEQHGIEGTGIGLPLALALTEAMHGTLEVSSYPGHGSTFTVRLPHAQADAEDTHAELVRRVAPPPGQAALEPVAVTVLSIEDNAANATLLARLFQDWPGATLLSSTTGQSGIDTALAHRPDVILLDLHLPDMPGEEVFTRLRAEPTTAAVPVIVLSADATPGTVRRLLARGVSGYLTKPVDLRQLHELINTLMAGRSD